MNPETTSGGRALGFYSSIRINIRAGERITGPGGKEDVIGHVVNIRVVKNKTSLPWKQASFDLMYGIGVDKVKEVIDNAALVGYITRAGAYYQFKDENNDVLVRNVGDEEIKMSFQGKDALTDFLKQDIPLYEILKKSIEVGVAPTTDQIVNNIKDNKKK